MIQSNDYGFLLKRLDRLSLETSFFQIFTNIAYLEAFNEDELKRESILLNFEQKIWKYDINIDLDSIKIFQSYFYNSDISEHQYFMHDIQYSEVSKSNLIDWISCLPTLSFRTVILDNNNHVKFGLPIYFGKVVRLYPIIEALTAMFVSDCVRNTVKIPKLDFFYETKCYYYSCFNDYSISHRFKESSTNAIPVGNYFNKILYFSDINLHQRFEEAKGFLEIFLEDYDNIIENLSKVGLGLEIPGQNLLLYLDSTGAPSREYLYRDFSQCTITEEFLVKNRQIDEYYKTTYQFKFNSTNQIQSPKVRTWISIRLFIFGFMFFNLDRFQKMHCINFDVYNWGAAVINKCKFIKHFY